MSRPVVCLIAAVAANGVIGRDGGMPWRLSTDLKRFKALTTGKPVIMGRKTFESIGRPLAGRVNFVVTRREAYAPEGVTVCPTLDAAIAVARAEASRSGAGEVMVIGGAEVYAAAMAGAGRLYVTHVDAAPDGDAVFPAIDPADWRAGPAEAVPAGPRDSAATRFVVYERVDRARSSS